jgi:hypothetical protein
MKFARRSLLGRLNLFLSIIGDFHGVRQKAA